MIASIAVAFKLGEALWLRIVGIYSTVGLVVSILTMMTRALGAADVFEVLFELVCAPFYGVKSPMAVTVLMLILAITAYAFLNRMPQKQSTDKN